MTAAPDPEFARRIRAGSDSALHQTMCTLLLLAGHCTAARLLNLYTGGLRMGGAQPRPERDHLMALYVELYNLQQERCHDGTRTDNNQLVELTLAMVLAKGDHGTVVLPPLGDDASLALTRLTPLTSIVAIANAYASELADASKAGRGRAGGDSHSQSVDLPWWSDVYNRLEEVTGCPVPHTLRFDMATMRRLDRALQSGAWTELVYGLHTLHLTVANQQEVSAPLAGDIHVVVHGARGRAPPLRTVADVLLQLLRYTYALVAVGLQ